MHAQSYAGQQQAVRAHQATSHGRKESGRAETLFGLVLALTAMYGIGAALAFLVNYLVK